MSGRDMVALVGWLDGRLNAPFVWGRTANDCVSFVCGAIEAQTGAHPLPAARFGDWSSLRGATRVARAHGGLKAMVDAVLMPIPPALAMRGDIAAVADPAGPFGLALMVVEGATLVGPGAMGAERLPRSAMIHAWSAIHG